MEDFCCQVWQVGHGKHEKGFEYSCVVSEACNKSDNISPNYPNNCSSTCNDNKACQPLHNVRRAQIVLSQLNVGLEHVVQDLKNVKGWNKQGNNIQINSKEGLSWPGVALHFRISYSKFRLFHLPQWQHHWATTLQKQQCIEFHPHESLQILQWQRQDLQQKWGMRIGRFPKCLDSPLRKFL